MMRSRRSSRTSSWCSNDHSGPYTPHRPRFLDLPEPSSQAADLALRVPIDWPETAFTSALARLLPTSRLASVNCPKAYSIAVHDPQLAIWFSVCQCSRQPPHIGEYCRLVLALDSQDDYSRMLSRRVRANVGKIQVQRHEDSILRSTPGSDHVIIRPRQVLIGNRVRNESGVA